MPVIRGPEQVRVPNAFYETHNLRAPRHLMIAGETEDAVAVTNINDALRESVMYRGDSYFHTAGTHLLVLTLPYAARDEVKRIKQEHPSRLAQGYGLHRDQATEAMFVGTRHRKISDESILWIGRALGAEHIERTYYFDPSGSTRGIRGIEGLQEPESDLKIINDPRDVFSLVPRSGDGPEIAYTDALNLDAKTAEAMK
jgi:hypothetical protein